MPTNSNNVSVAMNSGAHSSNDCFSKQVLFWNMAIFRTANRVGTVVLKLNF